MKEFEDIQIDLERINKLINRNPREFKITDPNVIYELLENRDYEDVINTIRSQQPVPETIQVDDGSPAVPQTGNMDLNPIVMNAIISPTASPISRRNLTTPTSSPRNSSMTERSPIFHQTPPSPIIRQTSSLSRKRKHSDSEGESPVFKNIRGIFPNKSPSFLKQMISDNSGRDENFLIDLILNFDETSNKEDSVIMVSSDEDVKVMPHGASRERLDVILESGPVNKTSKGKSSVIKRKSSSTVIPEMQPGPSKPRVDDEAAGPSFIGIDSSGGSSGTAGTSAGAAGGSGQSQSSEYDYSSAMAAAATAGPSCSSGTGYSSALTSHSSSAEPIVEDDNIADMTIPLTNEDEEQPVDTPENVLQQLLDIFPNVDPDFLKNKANEFGDDAQKLEEFLNSNIGNTSLPSRKEYDAKVARKKEIERIKRLKVSDFLSEENNYNDASKDVSQQYKDCALAYLGNRFSNVNKTTFNRILKKHKYHLTPCLKDLSKVKSKSKKSVVHTGANPVEAVFTYSNIDIGFLKEYVYLKLETKIQNHKIKMEYERKMRLEDAKENGALLECMVCFDDEVLLEEACYCTNDIHWFCRDCVVTGSLVKIGENETRIKCFTEQCDGEISLATLKLVLPAKTYERFAEKRAYSDIQAADIEGLHECPFCNYQVIIPESERLITCKNPECGKISCKDCKEENHLPLRCEEVEKNDEVKARTKVEDAMTEAMVRECPTCKKRFLKSDGCNKMVCSCGTAICYLCKKKIENNYKHFYGHGATPGKNKCPLWSDNDNLHKSEVAKAAEAAKAEVGEAMLKNDPTLNMERPPANYNPNQNPGQNGAPRVRHGLPPHLRHFAGVPGFDPMMFGGFHRQRGGFHHHPPVPPPQYNGHPPLGFMGRRMPDMRNNLGRVMDVLNEELNQLLQLPVIPPPQAPAQVVRVNGYPLQAPHYPRHAPRPVAYNQMVPAPHQNVPMVPVARQNVPMVAAARQNVPVPAPVQNLPVPHHIVPAAHQNAPPRHARRPNGVPTPKARRRN